MTSTTILPILGILLLGCRALRFDSNDTLRSLVRDARGHVYLGAVNALFQLSAQLELLNKTVTGPVQDNPNCAPPQLGYKYCLDETDFQMSTRDNYNQLLLIDEEAGHLVACGNVFQGTCVARMLQDISFAIPESESFMPESYVVSTDKRKKSVAFIAGVEGQQSLFVGGYVSPDEFTTESEKKPTIANRQLTDFQNTDDSFTFFTNVEQDPFVQRSWHPKPFVDVTFVSAFSAEQFAYFFFHERVQTETVSDASQTETRVARTCLSDKGNTKSPGLSDSTYTSYIEIALTCSYENENYPALTGVKLAPADNFYAGDSRVLVGTFSNERNATKTAICAFSFDEINRQLNAKVTSCASGQGFKRLRSEITSRKPQTRCSSSRSTCTDVCLCNIKSDNYPLEADAAVAAASARVLDGEVVALATNVVQDQIELFVGVHSTQYSVLKYVLESPDRVHLISDYSSLAARVLQIEVLQDQDEVMILTENSVYTHHISVCSGYANAACDQCLGVKDPHCGWCEMSGTCTTQPSCTTDVWRTAGQCTSITTVEPAMMGMGTQSVGDKVTITTNNKYPVGTPLQCDFGPFGLKEAAISEEADITCTIPYLNPEIEGKHVIDVAIISGDQDVVLATAEGAFTFFNCNSYDTCSSCTGSAVGCGWCNYSNMCSHVCHTVTLPEQCPALTFTKSFIPAQTPHSVEIMGVNLPGPIADDGDSYQCLVTLDGVETTLPATYVNSSKLICATNHSFNSPQSAGQITVPVRVMWEDKEVEAERAPELDIYRCNILGQDCSSCRANSMLRRCGWCDELSQCLLQDGGYNICPNSYSSVCRGLVVDGFEPKHGPVEGGTVVTIRGSNLGSRPSDITSIKIAGMNCQVQSSGFEVSRTVLCRTSGSGTAKHGLLEVTTNGDQFTYPQSMFFYKRYKVEDVTPRCGIAAGGTLLTVRGDQLNIGGSMAVILAGTMCDVIGKPTAKEVTCKTRAGVVGDTKLQLKIDGGSASSPMMLEVVENPAPSSLSGNSSIVAGGISLSVNFHSTYQLDCVQSLKLVLQSVNRDNGEGECARSGPSSFKCHTPALPSMAAQYEVAYVNAHLQADQHLIALEPFRVYTDPVINTANNTNPDGYIEWPIGGARELVLNGQHLNKVPGIEVTVGGYKVHLQITNDHIVLTPPQYSVLKDYRARMKKGEASHDTRAASRDARDVAEDGAVEPDKRSHDLPSEYIATVKVKLGRWEHTAGKLYYTRSAGPGIPYVAIVIPIAGFIVLVVLLTYVGLKYQRSQRSHRRTLKEVRMHMEKLEMRVANECKDAFTALQTHLTDLQGGEVEIPFRPFSDFMANVLFPGTEADTRDLLARLSAPTSKVTETPQLAQFRRLLQDKDFLMKFVEVVEADPHFDVAHKCKMASLLVITISSDMGYLTEVLFLLMEKLIEKFLAKKNHPQLLLRRTESVADKLLTHWLNYCCYRYLRQHAGKSIFTLFSAIKQQLDMGPQDEITFEAKSSLNNEKMLRETIEFKALSGTVRDLNKVEHAVTLLTCDSIKQAKRKVIESVHRNKPASQTPAVESFDLMYIRSGNTPVILREDKAPIVEGWRKLSTLAEYKIEETPTFAMIPLSTDSEHSSLSPQAERRKASFLTTKRYRSKGNLITAGLGNDADKAEERHQVYHLIKPSHDICETDTLLSTKMMSEVFLTRLLSTKGTLQPYVDDLFNSVFMSRDRVPPCIKYLFDFLERQAQRHNVAHNQAYIHTWKNNSLSLRFWMNVLKNPHFLLDITQTPTIDSSLNIVCGVFMDSCSTSDKGLTKDSPINKLLYAKDIPRYKKQVQIHYEQVSTLPRPTLDFLKGLSPTGLNSTVAVSELLDIAKKYQKQLQTSFGPDSPSLNLKFRSVVDPNLLTTHNLV